MNSNQNTRGEKSGEIDANAIIVRSFLQGKAPTESFGPGVKIMTTDEIISALSEMADLSQDDVNRVLAFLGYRPGRNNAGSFGWMMKEI